MVGVAAASADRSWPRPGRCRVEAGRKCPKIGDRRSRVATGSETVRGRQPDDDGRATVSAVAAPRGGAVEAGGPDTRKGAGRTQKEKALAESGGPCKHLIPEQVECSTHLRYGQVPGTFLPESEVSHGRSLNACPGTAHAGGRDGRMARKSTKMSWATSTLNWGISLGAIRSIFGPCQINPPGSIAPAAMTVPQMAMSATHDIARKIRGCFILV